LRTQRPNRVFGTSSRRFGPPAGLSDQFPLTLFIALEGDAVVGCAGELTGEPVGPDHRQPCAGAGHRTHQYLG
jgi:hypothetical protein